VNVALAPHVDGNGTRVQFVAVPADMKKCPAWQQWVLRSKDPVFGIFFDGVPAFRGLKRATYTLHAICLEILNLPFHLRTDPRFTIVSDIVPGPKRPPNFRPCFIPLIQELQQAQYQVLFASGDYLAQVEMLQHKQGGYDGCCKCFKRSTYISAGTFDWAEEEGKDPPRTKTGADAKRLGTNARIKGDSDGGFHDTPCLMEVLDQDCIQQTPEDALHLVEGCLKRHLFPIFAGEKILTRPGNNTFSQGTWDKWAAQVKLLHITDQRREVLNKRWKEFCVRTGRTCTAVPFGSASSMTGEDWYLYNAHSHFITIIT